MWSIRVRFRRTMWYVCINEIVSCTGCLSQVRPSKQKELVTAHGQPNTLPLCRDSSLSASISASMSHICYHGKPYLSYLHHCCCCPRAELRCFRGEVGNPPTPGTWSYRYWCPPLLLLWRARPSTPALVVVTWRMGLTVMRAGLGSEICQSFIWVLVFTRSCHC
jgi:hypothetical protein